MTTRRDLIAAAIAGTLPTAARSAAAQPADDGPLESIAIIGTGRVAQAMGRHWVRAGHRVTFSSRTPTAAKAAELAETMGRAVPVTDIAGAAAAAAIVLLAVPYTAVRDTLAEMGDLTGKILIDPTNAPARFVDNYPLPANPDFSAAEEIQSWAPGAIVVKALNHVNHFVMADPSMGDGPVTICVAGDDPDAKDRVVRLIAQSGLEPLDVAPLIGARLIEALARIFSGYRYAFPDKTFEVHLRVRDNDLGPISRPPPDKGFRR